MDDALLKQALARADAAVAKGPHAVPGDGHPRTLHVAMGDPQADFDRVMSILSLHGLLGGDGGLRPDVCLVSVGDHFDWGPAADRERVARSGLRFVAWLASHPADQAVLLLGNHDLGRVGELADFTDATFRAAQAQADQVYAGDATDAAAERAFLQRWPGLPTAELAARDFSTWTEAQRAWVEHLLRARRFRVAHAAGPSLLVLHAGVTREDLQRVGLAPERWADASAVAAALNGVMDRAVADWTGGPLVLPGLHHPGNAKDGEGLGIFYQRPSLQAEDAERVRGMPRRRFDPRRLPLGLTQVVGHTRDKRVRELVSPGPARDGVLRSLVTDGTRVDYAHGPPPATGPDEAVMVFTDGAMREGAAEDFQLFDLDARRAVPLAR
ncbi:MULTISPECIES: metallophosphoesterase [Corallococcus]|uniref:metallophosphoesterase n=1 Tax=Corallococcus TaxID=83461 RepID=UPI00117FDA02|nr:MULTISPECIES: metallophosphoesterase [Corallococcus]NBD10036.1 transcriptional regulator [Corallococcus silvisoli]TSC28476.1 transcriptional regulator [Corallococcus sp. Z5C101001]